MYVYVFMQVCIYVLVLVMNSMIIHIKIINTYVYVDMVFVIEGEKKIGSCLWWRKCRVNGIGFTRGSQWWWSCFRVRNTYKHIRITFLPLKFLFFYIFLATKYVLFFQDYSKNSHVQRGMIICNCEKKNKASGEEVIILILFWDFGYPNENYR